MLRTYIRLLSCKAVLRYTLAAKIHTNCGRVLYCSYNKDLPNPELQIPLTKVPSHDSNFLIDQIRKAKTLDSILELFSCHQDVIKGHHIAELLNSIYNHSKEHGLNPETIKENQTFQDICLRVMKEVRALEADEIITVYRVLSSFGIRNNSYVMKSVLRSIVKQLNNLNLEQVAFLNFIITKQKHSALVDDLKLSLPLLLQVKIDRLLESDDMSQAVDCLHLAHRSRLKPVTVQRIVSAILSKAKKLSPSNAATVISAMVHINTPVDGYKQLLDASFEIVTENIQFLDRDQVLHILKICNEKGLNRNGFFSEVAKKVVLEKWNVESTQQVLRTFDAMKFHSPELKDHFTSVSCLDVLARTSKAA